jgi:outer membrane protein OmpA-like peptidoglycan-associated protein
MSKLVYFLLLMSCGIAVATAADIHPAKAKLQAPIKPGYNDSALILIPFEYKQSALYHAFTFEVIDSVVNILLKNDSVTLSIKGYSHPDEGSDTICKYLALNRALFVRDYILGRGVKQPRIVLVQGMSKSRSEKSNVNRDGHALNCRVELVLNFPPPPPPVVIADADEDGVPDTDDSCPNVFGYLANHGCPDSNAIIIPFDLEQSYLAPSTFKALDSVITLLRENFTYTISIEGHAFKNEGSSNVCQRLAMDRANVVKNYFISRNVGTNRIVSVVNHNIFHPLNKGRNPAEILRNARAQLFIGK